MDDAAIRWIIGRPAKIDEGYVRRREDLTAEAKDLICDESFRRRGRRRLTNLIRDVRIHIVVEALRSEGASLRAACRRVTRVLPLSYGAVESIYRKERRTV